MNYFSENIDIDPSLENFFRDLGYDVNWDCADGDIWHEFLKNRNLCWQVKKGITLSEFKTAVQQEDIELIACLDEEEYNFIKSQI